MGLWQGRDKEECGMYYLVVNALTLFAEAALGDFVAYW